MSADGCPPSLPRLEQLCAGVDLIVADVLAGLSLMADASVQCIVTSPPYLGLRDYGIGATDWPEVTYLPRFDLPAVTVPATRCVLGAEPSLLAFVGHLVLVARALRRVLRDDGTLWLNLGASYATGTTSSRKATTTQGRKVPSGWAGRCDETRWTPEGLPAKNIIPSPWAVAEALQADGWVLRAEIIWRKPNPMPEAVTDRPTVSHEPLFLLSKRGKYFYDREAIAEPLEHPEASTPDDMARAMTRRRRTATEQRQEPLDAERYRQSDRTRRSGNKVAKTGDDRGRPGDHRKASIPWEAPPSGTRNARSVWTIPTQPFKGAHFATFPAELARRCILAGTSAGGCCAACGAPRQRVAERQFVPQGDVSLERGVRGADGQKPLDASNHRQGYPRGTTAVRTLGWEPSCACSAATAPCVVLDPFAGSGTVGAVAKTHGRRAVLIEASERYAADCLRPRIAAAPAWQPSLPGGGA